MTTETQSPALEEYIRAADAQARQAQIAVEAAKQEQLTQITQAQARARDTQAQKEIRHFLLEATRRLREAIKSSFDFRRMLNRPWPRTALGVRQIQTPLIKIGEWVTPKLSDETRLQLRMVHSTHELLPTISLSIALIYSDPEYRIVLVQPVNGGFLVEKAPSELTAVPADFLDDLSQWTEGDTFAQNVIVALAHATAL